MTLPQVGDRIELLEMGVDLRTGQPDPCPIEPGATGTVRRVNTLSFGEHSTQISVDWDPHVGRSLSLVVPPDRFRIIERVMD